MSAIDRVNPTKYQSMKDLEAIVHLTLKGESQIVVGYVINAVRSAFRLGYFCCEKEQKSA